MCGCAYPLKQWVADDGSEPTPNSEVLPPYDPELDRWSSPPPTAGGSSSISLSHPQRHVRYAQTATGPKGYIGTREGEWFRKWEGVITRAVLAKYQSSVPLRNVDEPLPAAGLDGYNDV